MIGKKQALVIALLLAGLGAGCKGSDSYDPNYSTEIKMTEEQKKIAEEYKNRPLPQSLGQGSGTGQN